MTTYAITNTTSGHTIGDYSGETREHAIAAMLRDAGYRAEVVDGEIDTDCPNWNGGSDLAATRRPMTAAEQGEHDAEQRAHEALADQGDGGEWQSEDDATSGWGDYAATAASHLDVPESERAAWCDAYETAARETARRMYRDAQTVATTTTIDTPRTFHDLATWRRLGSESETEDRDGGFAARIALGEAEQSLDRALTAEAREYEDEQRDEEQRASEARAGLPTEITTGTTGARQWLCAARGECNVAVTVDYAEAPPRVLVEEKSPGYDSLDYLDPEGWTGGGFENNSAAGCTTDGATLRALRTEVLDAAAKRWRVVRRRLDAARRTASAA